MPTYYGRTYEQYSDYAEQSQGNAGRFPAGHWMVVPDGRAYRFTRNDGTVEVAGNLYQGALPVADATDQTCDVARAIGATAISATLGATAAAIDLYSEGTVHSNNDTGEGYAYQIRRARALGDGHAAVLSSGILTANLEFGESVQVALATDTEVTFTHNRFRDVLIHDSPPTAVLVGVSPGVAAANRWYWSQVGGMSALFTNGVLVIGDFCVPDASIDGRVMPSAAFETDGPYVGIVAHVNADEGYSLVDLKLG